MAPAFQFRSALCAQMAAHRLAVQYGRGDRGRSRNVLRISTQPRPTILYVKESNSQPRGFWGLTRSHIERFEAEGARWFVVLLLRSADSGYLLSGGQVMERVRNGAFEIAHDKEYKVNEGPDLLPGQRFVSMDQLIQRTL